MPLKVAYFHQKYHPVKFSVGGGVGGGGGGEGSVMSGGGHHNI